MKNLQSTTEDKATGAVLQVGSFGLGAVAPVIPANDANQITGYISVRQKIALDVIVEYRRPELPKAVVIDPPVLTVKPKIEPEPAPDANAPLSSVTYLQQLTISALQGLCSNPAYCNQYEDLPAMADGLARSVINLQEGSDASD
ncbi:hypothetical protein [Enterobacter kobei]|uniref:hypothetical protein n=1 Tax=Enterobacter kobei TaxID=208224 RepID=UPI003ED9481B